MGSLGGLIAFVVAWFVTQVAKLTGALIKKKGKVTFADIVHWMTKSGGMPSGHTASFVSLSVFLGLLEGFTSSIFVLATGMTIIIIYDALNVRRAVGEQGKVMNKLVEGTPHKSKKLKVVEGHTMPEAIVGGILGVLIGWGVFVLMNSCA